MTDAASYQRLSRKRKSKSNPEGLSENVVVQQVETGAYIESQSWTLAFSDNDDDRSASKFTNKPRPAYERLIQAVRANRVEVIVVTEMTRLYRRMEELLYLIKLAETTRLKSIETTDGIAYDLSTAEGVHAAIGAVNNSMRESAVISKRVARKKAVAARQGLPSGGGRAFGYEQDGLTIRQSEADYLIEAKDRYLAGETMRDIVRDFFDRGVVSPYDKPWTIENFQRVLFSERYIAVRVHKPERGDPEERYPAKWPKLWEAEEREFMLARAAQRTLKWPGKSPGTGRRYMLTGLVFCGRCGTGMIGSRRELANGSYQYRYKCRWADNHGHRLGCGRVYRDTTALDAFITEVVLYRYDTPEVAAALADDDEPDITDKLIADYQAAKLRHERMVSDYASGLLDAADFAIAKRVTADKLDAAKSALENAQARKTQGVIASTQSVREAFENGGVDLRHQIIGLIVERIIVMPSSPGGHTWRGKRFNPDDIKIHWLV